MPDEKIVQTTPTRREYVTYGGTAAAGGLLAGCFDDADDHSEPTTSGSDDDENAYTVTMEPVGTVEFSEPPETWFPYTADYADMGVALGQGEGLLAVELLDRFGTRYYEELPGVSVDETDLVELWQGDTDVELFYELDADVHLIDPNFMTNQVGWDDDDVSEVEQAVAPFIGNSIFSQSYGWHEYDYYSLYAAFEKVAEIFQAQARYEAFAELHDEVLEDVTSRLPDETLEAVILAPEAVPPESFYGYRIDGGTQTKQWEDLGVEDALARNGVGGFHETGGTIGYETLLEIDPDVLVIWQEAGVTAETFEEDVLEPMREDSVASNLTAVETDRVVFGGQFYQGPIIHLFQLEMAAQGIYPDRFEGDLFDRQRVADIVNGDL